MHPIRNLVFDLGLFDGSDTAFYLRKGFKVVAVEARHDLCERARNRFADDIRTGSLTILERAIWGEEGQRIPFYVRSGWSSVFRSSAERDGMASNTVEVVTTTMDRIFEEFGIPHYLKIDLEAAEHIVVEAVARCAVKPAFISVEDSTGDIAERLGAIGYDRFQMVNQGHLRLTKVPKPSREGNDVTPTLDGRCSGLFGHDLRSDRWVTLSRLRKQMRFWNQLCEKQIDPLLAYGCRRFGKLTNRGWLIGRGWADIHATTERTLNLAPGRG